MQRGYGIRVNHHPNISVTALSDLSRFSHDRSAMKEFSAAAGRFWRTRIF
jgi:hypothetical protein